MVAVVAGALSVAVDLVVLAVRGFGQSYGESLTSSGLLFRSVAAPLAGALVPLGLVGLYARQSEATGVPGLAGFLVAFVGTVLAQGSASAGLLADLGPVRGGQPPSPGIPPCGLDPTHRRRGGYRGGRCLPQRGARKPADVCVRGRGRDPQRGHRLVRLQPLR
jgi:hypothetical protein